VNDYIRWVKAMINHEDPVTVEVYKGLVKSRAFENPNANHLRPLTSPSTYAAGWEVCFYRGYMVVSHDGSIPGFGSSHFFLPDLKFGGAIFANASESDILTGVVMRELIDEVLKVPAGERPDWNELEYADESDDDEDPREKIRQALCPGIQESEPQILPLSTYTGEYWNVGYHGLVVQIKNDKLFIDASDRSMGFTLVFDHVCGQTKYVAQLGFCFDENEDDFIKAEFGFENDRAVKLGLGFEEELEELIWFVKTAD
jgi:hypothetical protein